MHIGLTRILGLCTLSFVLIGCALSPQTVTLAPTINPSDISTSGVGKRISVDVIDGRSTSLVGLRGGIYSTAEIHTTSRVVTTVLESLVDAFNNAGYEVVDLTASPDIRMAVEIIEVTYLAEGKDLVRAVNTGAVVRAVSVLASKTVTRSFRVSSRREVLKAPSEDENERLLNAELSNALGRLVESHELFN